MTGADLAYVRPPGLPQFRNPPVQHVRMEMVFEPLTIPVTRIRELLSQWEPRYPVLSERAPEPVQMDVPSDGPSGLRIQIANMPPIPLVRFAAEDGSRWIELQADRFACGWSRSSEGAYPRYPDLREEFFRLAAALGDFVGEGVQVVHMSMTYENEFPVLNGDLLSALSHCYNFGDAASSPELIEDLFNAGLNLRFQYGGDEPYAVLVAAALTNHTDQGVVSRMSLRYSGDPLVHQTPTSMTRLSA